jgi:centromeric protein E
MQTVPNARLSSSSSINPSTPGSDQDEESSGGEFNDGNASLSAQVRALQADLGDRNRYIVTLEKRLLQARRSSQNRTSYGHSVSPHNTKMPGLNEAAAEGRFELLLKDKDDEIAELRARLDDKERMVSALRSAARKRDAADLCASGKRFSGQSTEGEDADKLASPVEAPEDMVECF